MGLYLANITRMDQEAIKDNCLKFLQNEDHETAVLATASKDATPRAATIYYAVDEELNFYFLTATHTEKCKHLSENAKASLAIGFGPAYVTVQCQGEVQVFEKGSEEENFAISLIKSRMQERGVTWPIFQLSQFDQESIVAYKFVPQTITLINLDETNGLPITKEGVVTVL